MASFVDITPALGRGLSFAQGTPGGYDAIDVRRASLLGLQEGADGASSYKVTQRAAGANMSVDVAADQGGFAVQGDDVAAQGLYYVPQLAAALNLDVGAADPTNPRVDQIVLEARDDAHTGDGITRARVYVLAGTATAGATLDNRNGAATLPASTVRLADVLVPAASSSVTTANIRDRRPWARGAFSRQVRTAGNIPTATAGSWVEKTEMKVRLETSGNPVRIILRGRYELSIVGFCGVVPFIDGALATELGTSASQFGVWNQAVGAPVAPGTLIDWIALPSAGSHQFSWGMQTFSGGTATLIATAANALEFVVEELVRSSASND